MFVHCSGGLSTLSTVSSDRIDIFDAASQSWTTGTLSTPRHQMGATQLIGRFPTSSLVMFAGGVYGADINPKANVDVIESFAPCYPVNPCSLSNSLNCTTTSATSFTCYCLPGWTGALCTVEIDECASNPCGGRFCVDQFNGYVCCPVGFTGKDCQTDINECASLPCLHGTCIDRVAHYNCSCDPGWRGVRCEIDINECASTPCRNGGDCTDLVNGFTCGCLSGYNGVICQTDSTLYLSSCSAL